MVKKIGVDLSADSSYFLAKWDMGKIVDQLKRVKPNLEEIEFYRHRLLGSSIAAPLYEGAGVNHAIGEVLESDREVNLKFLDQEIPSRIKGFEELSKVASDEDGKLTLRSVLAKVSDVIKDLSNRVYLMKDFNGHVYSKLCDLLVPKQVRFEAGAGI